MEQVNVIKNNELKNYYTELKYGENLDIKLPVTSGTGYSWNLTSTPGLELIGKKTIQNNICFPHPLGRPGASTIQVWTYKGVGKGKQKVEAIYSRPWENKNEKPSILFVNVI